MTTLRKKLKAQARAAKANLDAKLLGLRHKGLEQLKERLAETTSHLDGDLAWNLASGVLAKVKAVRETLSPSRSTPKKRRTKKSLKKPARRKTPQKKLTRKKTTRRAR